MGGRPRGVLNGSATRDPNNFFPGIALNYLLWKKFTFNQIKIPFSSKGNSNQSYFDNEMKLILLKATKETK